MFQSTRVAQLVSFHFERTTFATSKSLFGIRWYAPSWRLLWRETETVRCCPSSDSQSERHQISQRKSNRKHIDFDHCFSLINYHNVPKINRIDFMAQIRNRALEPLYDDDAFKYDKVFFLNDIYFCWQDAIRLLVNDEVIQITFNILQFYKFWYIFIY